MCLGVHSNNICREGKNGNTLYFQVFALTWQTHYSGHALSPPPTDRDVSENTQVELVLSEHSYEQIEFKPILSLCFSCYFQHIWTL